MRKKAVFINILKLGVEFTLGSPGLCQFTDLHMINSSGESRFGKLFMQKDSIEKCEIKADTQKKIVRGGMPVTSLLQMYFCPCQGQCVSGLYCFREAFSNVKLSCSRIEAGVYIA